MNGRREARGGVAVSVMPLENRLDVIRMIGVRASRLGYDAFLLPETWSYDVHALLAAIALETDRITLGTSIVNCWSRSPATIAMGAATLAGLSGGRYALGLGASTPELVEGLHDRTYARPAERLRQTVVQVRALLRGERVPLMAVPEARPLKLNIALDHEIPVWIAALGDQTLRVAGEHGDGWLPFLVPRSTLRARSEVLRQTAAAYGRVAPIAVVPAVPVAVAETTEDARRVAEWFLAFYLGSMGSFYRDRLAAAGFEEAVRAVLEANPTGRTAIVPPIARDLLDEVTIYGTPDSARAQLELWHDAGADTVGLLLAPQLTAAQLESTLDAFAP